MDKPYDLLVLVGIERLSSERIPAAVTHAASMSEYVAVLVGGLIAPSTLWAMRAALPDEDLFIEVLSDEGYDALQQRIEEALWYYPTPENPVVGVLRVN